MRLSIQTLLLPGDDLSAKFENAARYGFDGVEIAVEPDFDLRAHASAIQQASAASGLPVSAICTHPMHDPLVPDAADRQCRLAALRDLLQLAGELGANGVVSVPVRPPHVFPDLSPWKSPVELLDSLTVEVFTRWAEDLSGGNACLFLEPLNRYETYYLNRVGHAVDLCQAIDHPRIKALADLFHMNIEEADWAEPLTSAGDHLGHVHIADNNRLQPGKGCMDFRPAFAALKEMNYSGFVSIECWSPDGPKIAGPADEALPATVAFLRNIWAEV